MYFEGKKMDSKTKAKEAICILEELIASFIESNGGEATNAEIVKALGLESDRGGKQKNYLSWSILGNMMGSGRVEMIGKKYRLVH